VLYSVHRPRSLRAQSSHDSPPFPSLTTKRTAITAGGRSSVSNWLRSSINRPASLLSSQRLIVEPSDFLTDPEQPEKHVVDSIGIACPGISDRRQCASPLAHFVSTFRICQPIEYNTALADHGITYTDYCRLRIALKAFLVDQDLKTKMHSSQ
jgi:hypothetical protein